MNTPKIDDADRTPADIRGWLTQICDLAADLPDPAVPGARQDTKTRRPVPSSRPPISLDKLSLLTEAGRYDELWEAGMQLVDPDGAGVLPYLWGWVRDIEATLYEQSPTLPDEAPETPTVANCCSWLSHHAEAAAATRQWPELVYGLRILRGAMRAATNAVRHPVEKPVPCSRCGEPLHSVGGQALWECGNGHQVSVQAVTLNQAVRILREDDDKSPTLRTLQRWALRPGLLTPVKEGPRSRLFDLGQIRKLAAEARIRDGA